MACKEKTILSGVRNIGLELICVQKMLQLHCMKIFFIPLAVAVLGGLILHWWGIGSGNLYAPQVVNNSPGVVQIQGDNNTVTQTAKTAEFVWENRENWQATLRKAPFPTEESQEEYFKILLVFNASSTPPSSVCLKLRTSTPIYGINPEGMWLGPMELNFSAPNYVACFKSMQEQVLVGVYSKQSFQDVDAQLVSD